MNNDDRINRGRSGRPIKVVSGPVKQVKRGRKVTGIGRVGEGNNGLKDMIGDALKGFKR